MLVLDVSSQCNAFVSVQVGIDPEKTVLELKRQVAELVAMEEESLVLHYRSERMVEARTLESYEMANFPQVIVSLQVQLHQIVVVTPSNKPITISADLSWRTEDLTTAIISKEPSLINASLQLIVDDTILVSGKTLREQEVTGDSTVQTKILLVGGNSA